MSDRDELIAKARSLHRCGCNAHRDRTDLPCLKIRDAASNPLDNVALLGMIRELADLAESEGRRADEAEKNASSWAPSLPVACDAGCASKGRSDLITICDSCKDALPPGLWTLFTTFRLSIRDAAANVISEMIKCGHEQQKGQQP